MSALHPLSFFLVRTLTLSFVLNLSTTSHIHFFLMFAREISANSFPNKMIFFCGRRSNHMKIFQKSWPHLHHPTLPSVISISFHKLTLAHDLASLAQRHSHLSLTFCTPQQRQVVSNQNFSDPLLLCLTSSLSSVSLMHVPTTFQLPLLLNACCCECFAVSQLLRIFPSPCRINWMPRK